MKTIARNKREFDRLAVESLFNRDISMPVAYMQKTARGVFLLDMQGNKFAYVGIANDTRQPILVSYDQKHKTYMYALSTKDAKTLLVSDSYAAKSDLAATLYDCVKRKDCKYVSYDY